MDPEEKMNNEEPSSWSSFLWWLAAANPAILKECPDEQERYRIIGLSVLVTWLFATLAWGYFFSTIVEDDLLIYPLALFFGFAIMTIDRNLIAAMNKNGRTAWLPFAFRIVLAITIGLFISQPIVLMLFQKDIATQMELNQQKKMQTFRSELQALNAPLVTEYSGRLSAAKNELQQKARQVQDYENSYIRETDGTGGSGKVGEAAIARVKKAAYLQAQQEYEDLKRDREASLALYQQKLDSIGAADRKKEALYTTTLTNGFLAQIEALNDLTNDHPPVRSRYRLIIFIITLIEVMPVLSKWLLPKGVYDEKAAQRAALGIYGAQLHAEKEKELQQHYQERSLETDKQSVDTFFEQSLPVKNRLSVEVLSEPQNGSASYSRLWKDYKRKVFSGKEL